LGNIISLLAFTSYKTLFSLINPTKASPLNNPYELDSKPPNNSVLQVKNVHTAPSQVIHGGAEVQESVGWSNMAKMCVAKCKMYDHNQQKKANSLER